MCAAILLTNLNKKYNNNYKLEDINKYINDINWQYYTSNDLDDVLDYLYKCINGSNITQLKKSIGISSVFNTQTFSDIKRQLGQNSVWSYIILDSKYKNTAVDVSDGTFIFYYSPVNYPSTDTGVITSSGEIRNIKSITLHKPTIPSTTYTNMNHKRLNIVIKELYHQSYYISQTQRAHWIIKANDNCIGNCNVLDFDDEDFVHNRIEDAKDEVCRWSDPKSENCKQEFKFNHKITHIDRLTLIIGNCDQNIPFDHDSDSAMVSSYASPTIITTTLPHKFTLPFYVVISGFTTDNVEADKIFINAINNPRGLLATPTGSNQFSLPMNTTSITPTAGLEFNVYYEDRRIIVPISIKHELDS